MDDLLQIVAQATEEVPLQPSSSWEAMFGRE